MTFKSNEVMVCTLFNVFLAYVLNLSSKFAVQPKHFSASFEGIFRGGKGLAVN